MDGIREVCHVGQELLAYSERNWEESRVQALETNAVRPTLQAKSGL